MGDICFLKGDLVSVADDCVMKVFEITKTGKLEMKKQHDLPKEATSVCTDEVQNVFVGDKTKEVNQYKIDNNELKIENPELAMKMKSEVHTVVMSGSKWVLGASGDESMTVYNTETGKTLTCSPGHTGCSVKNGSIDPEGNHVVTTGTDGYLNIYKLGGDSVSFVQKIKICEKKVKDDRTW